jgi:hypothetical protein
MIIRDSGPVLFDDMVVVDADIPAAQFAQSAYLLFYVAIGANDSTFTILDELRDSMISSPLDPIPAAGTSGIVTDWRKLLVSIHVFVRDV